MSRHPLIDIRMNDGSRHFGSLPEIYPWDILREHLKKLPGAVETDWVSDEIVEFWFDFTFKEHQFSVNNQFGEYWLFVDDPECPDGILTELMEHLQSMYRWNE